MSVQTPSTPETGHPQLSLPEPKQQKLLAPPRKKGKGWLWLLFAVALGAAAYYFVLPMLKTSQSTAAPGGKGGKKGGGTIPVVAARAKSGGIGVYFSGLGVVTP